MQAESCLQVHSFRHSQGFLKSGYRPIRGVTVVSQNWFQIVSRSKWSKMDGAKYIPNFAFK